MWCQRVPNDNTFDKFGENVRALWKGGKGSGKATTTCLTGLVTAYGLKGDNSFILTLQQCNVPFIL